MVVITQSEAAVFWWKLIGKVILAKKQFMQGLLTFSVYKQQQFGFQVLPFFLFFSSFQPTPVAALMGPLCTACIRSIGGPCATCLMHLGRLTPFYIVAACGPSCAAAFVVCTPVCIVG